jgi:hypothetical protein
MQQWHIHKKSRMPGFPYRGPTCDHAGVDPGKIYSDKIEAEMDARKLSRHNGVGFEVSPYPYMGEDDNVTFSLVIVER